MKKFAPQILAFVLAAGVTFAGTVVDQGSPGKYGPWPVTGPAIVFPSDGGLPNSNVTQELPYPCGATTKMTVYKMDGGAQTIGSLNPRVYIVVCNSKDSASGLIRCRPDGVPTLDAGSLGLVLDVGDCVPYSNTGGQTVKCIGGSNYVSGYECGP